MKSENEVLLSVCIITYNHSRHIQKALESVLSQKTNFRFEIIVGDDSSSDGTGVIIADYAQRYPETIRVITHSRNDVIYVNGSPTGRNNLLNTLKSCSGKYIAYLEGDDFWISNIKLQSQVDFLENNPDYFFCGHVVQTVDQNDTVLSYDFMNYPTEDLQLSDAWDSTPMHPNTWVFRNLKLELERAYSLLLKAPAGDDVLALIFLAKGKGKQFKQVWSSYRIHSGGTWSTKAACVKKFEALQFKWIVFQLFRNKVTLKKLIHSSFDFFRVAVRDFCATLPVSYKLLINQKLIPRGVIIVLLCAGVLLAPYFSWREKRTV